MPVHVHPENDLIDHELTEACVCGPKVDGYGGLSEMFENGPVVIHHSMDGRERHAKLLEDPKDSAVFVARGKWLCTEVEV